MVNGSESLVNVTTTTKGTNSFWAPELLELKNPVRQSEATDVWAFGMTIYVSILFSAHTPCLFTLFGSQELMCRKRPYESLNQLQIILSIRQGLLPEFVPKKRLSRSERDLWFALTRICLDCWRPKPNERLRSDQLRTRLALCHATSRGPSSRESQSVPSTDASTSPTGSSSESIETRPQNSMIADDPDSHGHTTKDGLLSQSTINRRGRLDDSGQFIDDQLHTRHQSGDNRRTTSQPLEVTTIIDFPLAIQITIYDIDAGTFLFCASRKDSSGIESVNIRNAAATAPPRVSVCSQSSSPTDCRNSWNHLNFRGSILDFTACLQEEDLIAIASNSDVENGWAQLF